MAYRVVPMPGNQWAVAPHFSNKYYPTTLTSSKEYATETALLMEMRDLHKRIYKVWGEIQKNAEEQGRGAIHIIKPLNQDGTVSEVWESLNDLLSFPHY